MKVVAIKSMSAGNESVGEMWQETKIFDHNTPVGEIIKWAKGDHESQLKKHLVITEAEESYYYEED